MIFEPLERLLTHCLGSVRVLSGDRTIRSEIGQCPKDFYENVYLKIVQQLNCLRPGAWQCPVSPDTARF